MTRSYFLDARTATAHFPGIGRYVRNLAPALISQLAPEEHILILWNPTDPTSWNPSSLAGPQVTPLPVPVSPFSLRQQWALPGLLRRSGKPMRRRSDGSTKDKGRRTDDRRRTTHHAPTSQSPNPPTSNPPISNLQSSIFNLQSSTFNLQSSIFNLQSSLYHSTYYLMPYRPGLPTVLTVYDLIAMLHPETVSWRARLLFRFTTRLALRAADQVIAISQATRRDLLAHFPVLPERVTSIPLAPDPRFRPQPAEEIDRVRRKHHLPQSYLLYLGINKPHKNLVRLVDAFAQWSNAAPASPMALVIAGAWDERYPEPKRRVDALGLQDRVHFLGPVGEEDLPGLYSGCTAFVFPSLYEGFGLPVLEAMACGAPVICGDRSSLPEVAGDAALQVDPTNVSALAAALEQILGDEKLRRILAERGQVQAARFSWQRTAAETLAVYRRAAAESL